MSQTGFVKAMKDYFGLLPGQTILQFGESGDPASPHWFDQAALYAKKQFKQSWYAQADVEAHSERHYHPGEH